MSAFVCVRCRQPVASRWDQYTERIEYRRIDGLKRAYGRTLRDLCRGCVEALVEEVRNPSGAEQGRLL